MRSLQHSRTARQHFGWGGAPVEPGAGTLRMEAGENQKAVVPPLRWRSEGTRVRPLVVRPRLRRRGLCTRLRARLRTTRTITRLCARLCTWLRTTRATTGLCTRLGTRLSTWLRTTLTSTWLRRCAAFDPDLRGALTIGPDERHHMGPGPRILRVHVDRPRVPLLTHRDGARCGRVGREIRTG